MSKKRDELALTLRQKFYGWMGPAVSYDVADEVLAAGYRKLQAVATIEELDALPFETVIRDGDDCVLERWGDLEESGWVTVMVTSFVPRDQITLPATVLHEGTKRD